MGGKVWAGVVWEVGRIDSVGGVPRVVCWFSGAGRDEAGLFVLLSRALNFDGDADGLARHGHGSFRSAASGGPVPALGGCLLRAASRGPARLRRGSADPVSWLDVPVC